MLQEVEGNWNFSIFQNYMGDPFAVGFDVRRKVR